MKDNYISDKTFLARWLAGELSEAELSEFEASEAYKDFERINTETQKFTAPPIDKRKALIEVKERISFRKKSNRNKRTLFMSIAASVVILLGMFGLFNSTKNYTTSYGEKLAITLPDGSNIQLNANSKLSHKRFFWLKNRHVTLEGEGYFEVEKGDGFQVETNHGTISVLGTKFNIKTRLETFALNCFEGTVRFDKSATKESQILKQGDGITISRDVIINKKLEAPLPHWLNNMSVFKEAPLKEVLEELKLQYNIAFNINDVDITKLFTGSFLHNDLEKALKSTLSPMGISYTLSKDKTTISLQ